MKGYTDIEQSKKLAEILPLESADNVIVSFGGREGTKTVVMPKETLDVIRTPFADIRETTMCWSLAALLEQFEDTAGLARDYGLWFCYDNRKSYCTKHYDNPVDACCELILKLHELNLL